MHSIISETKNTSLSFGKVPVNMNITLFFCLLVFFTFNQKEVCNQNTSTNLQKEILHTDVHILCFLKK